MCRGPVALAPVDVFRGDAEGLATFMCECQVEHLSAHLPHAKLLSPFHVEEVNSALADARADCLQRYRRSRAGADEASASHGGSLRAASFWRP